MGVENCGCTKSDAWRCAVEQKLATVSCRCVCHHQAVRDSGPAVVLTNPKYPHNVGGALRACACWGVDQLWWTGDRVRVHSGMRLPREERMKGFRVVELGWEPTVREVLAHFDTKVIVPVAVEIHPGAESLVTFDHPETALYFFGPEDGSLSQEVRRLCHRFVMIPTHFCLNLAAAVNIVLWDRRFKRQQKGLEPMYPLEEILKERRGMWQNG